jgi:hypothetical protein
MAKKKNLLLGFLVVGHFDCNLKISGVRGRNEGE